MNAKNSKKIRKGTKHSFIIFLREKPKFLPRFIWRICAVIIFNNDGIELIGALYGLKNSITVNGKKYRIKK